MLVVSPHPDDETFACGGLIAKAKAAGTTVGVLVMSVGSINQFGSSSLEEVRLKEMDAAFQVLKVDRSEVAFPSCRHLRLDTVPDIELVEKIESGSSVSISSFEPDIFVFPGPSYNQDHIAVTRACLAAIRPYPSHLKHTPNFSLTYSHLDERSIMGAAALTMEPNFFADISEVIDQKLEAVACYSSQLKQSSLHWRTAENIRSIASVCGKKAGVGYAEEFQVLRIVG